MIDSQDPMAGCDCSKFNSPVLRAGCENFYSLMWDNAPVEYEEVSCPPEIDQVRNLCCEVHQCMLLCFVQLNIYDAC